MMKSPSPSETCTTNATRGMYPLPVSANGHTIKWIVDSGDTHHITYCENLLSNCRKLSEPVVIRYKYPKEVKFM